MRILCRAEVSDHERTRNGVAENERADDGRPKKNNQKHDRDIIININLKNNKDMENNKITMEMLSKKMNEDREFSEQCLKQIKEIVASRSDKEIDVDEMDGDYIYAVVGTDYETREERITKLSLGGWGELVLETESGYTVKESDVCYREVVYPCMLEILMDMNIEEE